MLNYPLIYGLLVTITENSFGLRETPSSGSMLGGSEPGGTEKVKFWSNVAI